MGTHPIFESDFDCLTDCQIMGVTVVWSYEPEHGVPLPQAIAHIKSKLEDCGAQKEGNFKYESEFYKSMDKKSARDFYTLKTSEYPATIFARVDDGDRNKNTCMQCDNPLESLLFKIRAFFQPKRKYEVQGTRYKRADFWIRPGIVTCNGSSKAVTVELEYAPSYFADDCWPLIKEFGDEIMNRVIDNKPPIVMENKQFQASFIVQQYVEIFSREPQQQSQQLQQQQLLNQQQQQA